jgi:hypothetical protein
MMDEQQHSPASAISLTSRAVKVTAISSHARSSRRPVLRGLQAICREKTETCSLRVATRHGRRNNCNCYYQQG